MTSSSSPVAGAALPMARWQHPGVAGARRIRVSLVWKGRQLREVTVVADRDGQCLLQVGDLSARLDASAGRTYRFGEDLQPLPMG